MIRFEDYFPLLYSEFQRILLPDVIGIVMTLAIPCLAIILGMVWWPLWVNYVRSKNFYKIKYAVFEIKLPKETFKSPKAMELFLHALHNTSDGNKLKQFWNGETRPWYSLELASVEGQVKFYIWGEEGRKIGLMSALYAQFPGIEVRQVPDYTRNTFYDPKTMKVWAAEFTLNKKEPYPIKTYVDYGLDKDPKEELKVDPLVPGLEFLASVGANQQVWIQLIVRAHKDEQKKPGILFKKHDAWKEAAEKEINKIMRRDPKTKIAGAVDADGKPLKEIENKFNLAPTLSDAEKEQVAALSRKLTKLPFDVCARVIYIAKKENFDTPFGIGGNISFFKAFNTENLNGFKPNGDRWMPWLDAPWKDFKDIRRDRFSREAFQAFKMRSAFYVPFNDSTVIVLNSEELATVYHFPGSVAATPTLERVPSKKGEAPANLPV
jgi:hypothetical protein